MTTFITPVILWMVAGVVSWLAGRYHLDLNQQQQISADITGGVLWVGAFGAAMWTHWKARIALPPNGGNNVQMPRGIGGGTGVFGPGPRSGPSKEGT